MMSNDSLARRRAAMIAAGYWCDQTLLDHLNRAIQRTPDKTAIVAIRSESGEEKRLTYKEIGQLSDWLAARLAQLTPIETLLRPVARDSCKCEAVQTSWAI